ncbi:MAG: hypothetical protein OEY95_06765 [Candidatus Bathyarchaeota archaeon]|nr:hypothetical protein [Candidatus Bathyarchaeota archaeon]MDH5754884.1 hypothetical protein [Candidatus Bathyarchaeota archaeon]
MPARKMRIELFDSEGNKYTIAFEGQITREKALRLLDLVELLGGMPGGGNPVINAASNEFSKYDKVRMVIQRHFPLVWFSSKEIQYTYEQEFKEPITLSTVATYLARIANKGMLVRTGASNRLKYRSTPNFPQATLKQQIP